MTETVADGSCLAIGGLPAREVRAPDEPLLGAE
jgi:hypothetical protein